MGDGEGHARFRMSVVMADGGTKSSKTFINYSLAQHKYKHTNTA